MPNNKSLWAPWRMDYIRSPKLTNDLCIFCEKSQSQDDNENLIVHRGKNCFILLNLYPYNNGHIMISPYQHIAEFHILDNNTQVEMMKFSSKIMGIMKSEMSAEGFNFGANFGSVAGAGIKEHIHLHIVPRWEGDTNFMPVLGHTKIQVEGLKETHQFLQKHFSKL
jgi:ATP adenylyltransferase